MQENFGGFVIVDLSLQERTPVSYVEVEWFFGNIETSEYKKIKLIAYGLEGRALAL